MVIEGGRLYRWVTVLYIVSVVQPIECAYLIMDGIKFGFNFELLSLHTVSKNGSTVTLFEET